MFSQLFGKYLVDKGVFTEEQLREVLNEQSQTRVKLGTIAVADKLLTEKQAEEINHLQTQMDKRFGDIAVEQGYLQPEQVEALLGKQGNATMKFIQIITEKKYLDIAQLDEYLTGFQKEKGFSQEEMKALKDDDIDVIVPLFAFSPKPYVTDIAGLVLRNIMRFVSTDFYIDRVKKVDSFEYSYIMGQKSVGDHTVYLGFAATDNTDGVLEVASGYAGETFQEMNDAAMDAICEFANMNDGLFVSELSQKNVDVDMEPPFVYTDGEAKGRGYVLPVHVNGKEVFVYIAVDSDIDMGDKLYQLKTEKQVCADTTQTGKGRVMIVDDSQLIRKMLRALVESNGYVVVGEAVNGQEAIEEYKRLRPDIVTLDITMPILDGVGALKGIMEFDSNAKAVMVTAAGQKQKVVEALKLGAKGFIMKPISNEDVMKSFAEL